MNILVINGPNINLLGEREPDIYGKSTYRDLVQAVSTHAKRFGHKVYLKQTNHEGSIIDLIQKYRHKIDCIIINPGAFTHYSYAIYDCLKSVPIPAIEVHLSDIHQREAFRKVSVIAPACIQQISGKGIQGYLEALDSLTKGQTTK
ncbi:MAG: 3-dehydroquinate dehydratase [Candidatus Izemoplasmatales bacterium]|nr:3-dehydroquinate dehydratase [Candidatus Izemoplasmatales bacterium]